VDGVWNRDEEGGREQRMTAHDWATAGLHCATVATRVWTECVGNNMAVTDGIPNLIYH